MFFVARRLISNLSARHGGAHGKRSVNTGNYMPMMRAGFCVYMGKAQALNKSTIGFIQQTSL